jgi:aryl-phospho-beta-D-glucosidase BglC (GH1 family)
MWSHVYNDTSRAQTLDALAGAGITWVRIDLSWANVETSNGSYNTGVRNTFANCVSMANARGLNVLAIVAETPSWANGNAGRNVPPSNPNEYGEFLAWATGEFPAVAAWQIYNEPNLGSFWAGSVLQYVNVLKAGYAAIKAANSADKVITGGITFNNAAGWVAELYGNGGKGHFDAIATHPYQPKADDPPEVVGGGPSEWWFPNSTPAIRQVMVNNGDSAKQIWITEFGYSAHSNAGVPAGSDFWWLLGVSDTDQGEFTVRAIKYARQNWPYVGMFTYYKERSYPSGCCGLVPPPGVSAALFELHTENYGLLQANGSPRPALNRLKTYLTTGS